MAQSLGPREAEALIAAGGIDLVDVRDPYEWAEGHLQGSRNVPLELLKADPKGRLPRDKILFICAKGLRSQRAAEVAEAAGFQTVYSLEGGTHAWTTSGLGLTTPPEAAPVLSSEKLEAPERADPSCGLPEPGLDAVVGANLRELRKQRNLSLDAMAELTGLSRTLLGQIELGHSAPSVSMVWTIARAFDVHFSALLATPDRVDTRVLRHQQAKRLVSPDGRFSSRALYPLSDRPEVEFYELFLASHSREDAQPHQPGTRENLIVTAGRLELHVGGERLELTKGDAILFSADVQHSYVNPGSQDCWMYLVMTYAKPATPGPAPVPG